MELGKKGGRVVEIESYSQITNEFFYLKDGETTTEKGSILNTIKDDKVIIILHELYTNTSFKRTYQVNLDFLIEQCGYQVNQKSRKSFDDVLNKLREINLIAFSGTFKDKIVVIDTEQLILKSSSKYFHLLSSEVKIINAVDDLRLRNTLLKLYLYLKARTKKRGINDKTGKVYNIQVDATPQVTWQTYEYIEQYTNIGQSHIREYINKLKELKLIDYANCGKKYHSQDKNKKLSECPNVYTICNLNPEGNEQELEYGLKQCKQSLEDKGWIITKTNYKNNNRQLNGKKGGLIKKLNNGTITEKQLKELEELTKEKEEQKE